MDASGARLGAGHRRVTGPAPASRSGHGGRNPGGYLAVGGKGSVRETYVLRSLPTCRGAAHVWRKGL